MSRCHVVIHQNLIITYKKKTLDSRSSKELEVGYSAVVMCNNM